MRIPSKITSNITDLTKNVISAVKSGQPLPENSDGQSKLQSEIDHFATLTSSWGKTETRWRPRP